MLVKRGWQCAVNLAAYESVNETLYVLILAGPLIFFIVALCLAPFFLYRYKKRVTALMSTRANIETEPDRMESVLTVRQNKQPLNDFGRESKDTLWPAANARLSRFDSHILRTVALHIGLIITVTILGNLHELTGNLLEDAVGMLALITLFGLLGTSMIESLTNNSKVLIPTAILAVFLIGIAVHIESKAEPELWEEGEVQMILGLICLILAALHAGLSGRQLRNIVPYLAVALTLSSLVGYLVFRLQSFSTCLLDSAQSEAHKWITISVGMIAGLLLAGRVIKWVASLFEQKRLSDRQIRIGCWLLFTSIVALMMLQVDDDESMALRPIAMLIPAITGISFWFYLRKSAAITVTSSAQRLLLLRVFSSDKRGEKWLSSVERFWRHLGPVYLIAGPDLAKSSIDPYELYQFLSRNIKSLFIRNEQQASKHLEETDNQADADGRFRINEFFCLDDTWEFVAQGLIKQSDVVVLDLRDFELSRVGTAKEIEFLSRFNAFSRSLVLVNNEEDIVKLIEMIRQLTGLQIAQEQFAVATELSARETVMRLLDLREQNLDQLYVSSQPSDSAYLTDESLQEAKRENSRRDLIDTHEQSTYGVDYVVLALGITGLFALWIQLLAALYLLARKVSLKRVLFLVLITYGTSFLTYTYSYYLAQFMASGMSQNHYLWFSIVLLVSSVFLSIAWFYLSRRAKRWIREAQEPLRTALKLQNAMR